MDKGWYQRDRERLRVPRRAGTLAPFFRASDNPIAMACLRLFTFPPLPPGPDRRVPFFRRRMALSTRLLAASPYRRLEEDFFREEDDRRDDVDFRLEARLRLALFRELFFLVDFLAAIDPPG
jgi:hypothetical protein